RLAPAWRDRDCPPAVRDRRMKPGTAVHTRRAPGAGESSTHVLTMFPPGVHLRCTPPGTLIEEQHDGCSIGGRWTCSHARDPPRQGAGGGSAVPGPGGGTRRGDLVLRGSTHRRAAWHPPPAGRAGRGALLAAVAHIADRRCGRRRHPG